MVKYQRKNLYNQWKKSEDYTNIAHEDEKSCLNSFVLIFKSSSYNNNKKAKRKLLYIILLCFVSCSLILAPHFFSSTVSLLYSLGFGSETDVKASLCSSVPNGTICCDRSSIRSDICFMRGNIRTHSASSSIFLYNANIASHVTDDHEEAIQHEKIRPYTRKWETNVMNTVSELNLITKQNSRIHHRCDVHHKVPAIFFSTGGYTGNLYHEFNDGILPLYITSQHWNKKVVFVILDYHDWWITKYRDVLSQLSHFPVIDFSKDKKVHCFPEAIIGLRIHNELSIDPSLMIGNKTIVDFHDLLDRAYWPRIRSLIHKDRNLEPEAQLNLEKFNPIQLKSENRNPAPPKLVIVSRKGSRAITNEDSLAKIAEDIGFLVQVLRPTRTTELPKNYRVLNSSDIMLGVHGAAMTHFLFMKPGSVFIQVVPLGTDWAAENYYGEPATRFGAKYIGYKILPRESSLYNDYDKNDPVLIDPSSVNRKGWEFTKKIYLDHQTVRLDLGRFRKHLVHAYYYTIARKHMRKREGIATHSYASHSLEWSYFCKLVTYRK